MQRRKMLKVSLQALVPTSSLLPLFTATGIDPQSRPENLPLSAFIQLSLAMQTVLGSAARENLYPQLDKD